MLETNVVRESLDKICYWAHLSLLCILPHTRVRNSAHEAISLIYIS